jgi:THO complex subunit 1
MAVIVVSAIPSVASVTARLQALLRQARTLKNQTTVDPPLFSEDLVPLIEAFQEDFADVDDQTFKFNVLETAARDIFYALIGSTAIDDPAFVQVWNLLDILQICGDQGICSPELVCSLIEELLDSQTTHGCRIVFDYLESRRERLAQKDFHRKNLIFLRACNELLRRLSRAEDAIFCGRVFFFLFQTFPLGDKSSVNLRGEFHVENTTKFEVAEAQPNQNGDKMEVDGESAQNIEASKPSTPQPATKPGSKAIPIKAPAKKDEEVVLSNDELYPIFWRLQQDFCEPTRLFAASNFQTFKKGLEQTISKFKKTPTVVQTQTAESRKRGTKRKLGEDNSANEVDSDVDHIVDNYNPKYLTSRDLFDLELSDMAFQRHILVQALILIDFLLSLTEKAKKKLHALDGSSHNKSMLYNSTLNDDEAKWATALRSNITTYLSASPEGRLFNRMVETVLARDKNWVRWKVESCPSIVREPVSTESEMAARKGTRDATRLRRLHSSTSGMDLSFLDEGSGGCLEDLKVPFKDINKEALQKELLDGIGFHQMDLDLAVGEEITSLNTAIANKSWRLLRQTRASQLALLDKVEPGKDMLPAFRSAATETHDLEGDEEEPSQPEEVATLAVDEDQVQVEANVATNGIQEDTAEVVRAEEQAGDGTPTEPPNTDASVGGQSAESIAEAE